MLLCTLATAARADCEIVIGVDPSSIPVSPELGIPVLNGIVFAVDDRWHGRVAGCRLSIANYDDVGPNGKPDPPLAPPTSAP